MSHPPAERPPITSPTNERVKAAVRLRDRRERDRTGLTIVDGARELRRAIEAGIRVETLFVAESGPPTPDAAWVVASLGGSRSPAVVAVSAKVFAKIAFGDRDDGLVGMVAIPSVELEALVVEPDPLIVVVDGVEKPGNLGAILRSADGAGVDAVLLTDARTDPFNPNAIRASLGTVFGTRLAVADPASALSWLRRQGVRLVTAEVGAPRFHTDTDLTGALAIVVGSESDGLGPAWLDTEREPVRIPMRGRADSLNVSVATAILLYEALRQRDGSTAADAGVARIAGGGPA